MQPTESSSLFPNIPGHLVKKSFLKALFHATASQHGSLPSPCAPLVVRPAVQVLGRWIEDELLILGLIEKSLVCFYLRSQILK
jgi:hypothetical protein